MISIRMRFGLGHLLTLSDRLVDLRLLRSCWFLEQAAARSYESIAPNHQLAKSLVIMDDESAL